MRVVRDRAELREYLSRVACALELSDWRLSLEESPPGNDDALAEVRPTYGRRIALIYIDDRFFELSREAQRVVVAHELIHLHLEPASKFAREALDELLGKPALEAFWQGFTLLFEYGVDAIAHAVAPALPLPGLSPKATSVTPARKEPTVAKKRSAKQKAASRRNLRKARSARRKGRR